ncbi:MFS transporter [Streptomyces sp. NPDC048567]|uniref:MFS transporter n=1 Tax=unclassified Streptomyces TaxID=2593676 RepID=UPI000AAAF1DE|nr:MULTISPECIES: MFS transporter [unclassified Streptomyces]WUD03091.1 MFS transporter [Streptomyces sp. NBC_00523]
MAAAGQRFRTALTGGPLSVHGFRLLLAGQLSSTVGDYCYAVALPWLILSGDGGPVLLGTVLACYGIPRVVTIPLGGVVADRIGGRRVMLMTDLVRAAAVGILAVLASAGTPTLGQLAPIAVVLGACSGMFIPASYTLLPALLRKEDLGRGNALSTMVNQVGGLLGPTAGGALVAAFDAGPALIVDAASFLVSALVLARIRTGADAPEHDGPDAADEPPARKVSFPELLRHGRLLHVVLVVALVCNLAFNGTIEVALPELAHQGMGATGYGILLTCLSLGGLAGSLVAARSRPVRSPAYLFAALAVVMGLALSAVPYAGGLAGAAVCVCVYALASGWQNIVVVTMLQVWAPSALIGRVMSLVMLAVMGTFPVSVAVAGFGVRHLGAAPFFPVAGGAIALTVLGALTQRVFREHRADTEYAPPVPVPAGTPAARSPHPGQDNSQESQR